MGNFKKIQTYVQDNLEEIRLIQINVVPFGVFILFVLMVPLWLLVLAPHILALTPSFSYNAEVISQDRLYDQQTQSFRSAQTTLSKLTYSVESVNDGNLIIKNSFNVRGFDGEEIFQVDRRYGIDPKQQQHVQGYGDKSRNGYLFGKPNSTDDFIYWHVNYDRPIYMEYAGSDVLYGIQAFKFTSSFEVDQTEELSHSLDKVGETQGIRLAVDLSLWIEPVTGYLLKYEDFAQADYYDFSSGEFISPWNTFNNVVSEDSVQKNVEHSLARGRNIWFITYIPTILFILFGLFSLGLSYRPNLDGTKSRLETVIESINSYTFIIFPLIIIIIVLVASSLLRANTQNIDLEIFESGVDQIEDAIDDKMSNYKILLEGSRGLFEASDGVTREEWTRYLDSVDFVENYPGNQGVGYSIILDKNEKTQLENNLRSNGFPGFKVFPEGDREIYTAIIYLEPFDARNQRAFGYDMYTEEVRRGAMDTAIVTNSASLSGKVKLVQEFEDEVQNGFLVYLPVYKRGEVIETANQRRAAIEGFVYSPFRAGDFVQSLEYPDTSIHFALYDGIDDISEENLLAQTEGFDAIGSSNYSKIRTIYIHNRPLTIYFRKAIPEQTSIAGNPSALFYYGFDVAGLILAVLLGITIYLLTNSNKKAHSYARTLNATLIKEKNLIAKAKAEDEAILANIGEGLIVTDDKGTVTYANPTACDLLKLDKNTLIGKKWARDIPIIHEGKNRVSFKETSLYGALNKGRKITIDNHIYSNGKNRSFPAQVTATPIQIQKQTIGCVVIFRDTTKEKEVDKAKSEFVALTSHQLRTPLTTIKWYSQALLSGETCLNEEQIDYMREINIANQRMIDLVNSFMSVSKIEKGTLDFKLSRIDLVDEIQTIISGLKKYGVEKHVTVEFESNQNVIPAMIDQDLFQVIITNLVTNAIKYSHDDSVVKVRLSGESDSKKLVLEVSDTGIGIPQEEQGKIFQKLFRASNAQTKETDGNGLGLYLVKSIVDSSRGKISFNSSNKGTTFIIKWPQQGMKPKK